MLLLFTVAGKLWSAEALTLLLPPDEFELLLLIPMLDKILENGEELEEEVVFVADAAAVAVGLAGAGGLGFGGGVVLPKEARLLLVERGGGVTRLSRLLSFLVASFTDEELFLFEEEEMFSVLVLALLFNRSLEPAASVELRRKEDPDLTLAEDGSLRALTAGLLGGREGFLLAGLLPELCCTELGEGVREEEGLLTPPLPESWKIM